MVRESFLVSGVPSGWVIAPTAHVVEGDVAASGLLVGGIEHRGKALECVLGRAKVTVGRAEPLPLPDTPFRA